MKDVTIYSSDTCKYCHLAKDFLKENNIEYTDKNVSSDPTARKELMKMGFMGVPVIMVDDEIIQGFDKERLTELLLK